MFTLFVWEGFGIFLKFVGSFSIPDLLREVVVSFGAVILEASLEFHSFR